MTSAGAAISSQFAHELAARLDCGAGEARRRVVIWELAGTGASSTRALESSMLGGLAATHATLFGSGGVDRLVHVVALSRDEPRSCAVHAFVEAFAKSTAREVARDATTVNVVATDPAVTGAADYVGRACGFLLSDEAGFVTGQSFTDRAARYRTTQMVAPTANDTAPGSVLVSGGGGAIGSAIVRRLHAIGWSVVIGQTSSGAGDRVAAELGSERARAAHLDLVEISDTAWNAAAFLDEVGPLHAAVLCGGWNRTAPFLETSVDEWRRTLAINLTGAVAVVTGLQAVTATPVSVVGIGSESARIGDRGRAVYAGAKAALAAWLRALDAQGTEGFRAATVSPGPIDTPLMHETHGDQETAARQMAALRRLVPLGRFGTPDEIAAAVEFLLSPAGTCLAGETLSVGGGITMQ